MEIIRFKIITETNEWRLKFRTSSLRTLYDIMFEGDLSEVVITPGIKKTIAGRYHSGESAVDLAKVNGAGRLRPLKFLLLLL